MKNILMMAMAMMLFSFNGFADFNSSNFFENVKCEDLADSLDEYRQRREDFFHSVLDSLAKTGFALSAFDCNGNPICKVWVRDLQEIGRVVEQRADSITSYISANRGNDRELSRAIRKCVK